MPQLFVRTLCVPKHLVLRCCTRKFTLLLPSLLANITCPSIMMSSMCIGKENDRNTDYWFDYQCNSNIYIHMCVCLSLSTRCTWMITHCISYLQHLLSCPDCLLSCGCGQCQPSWRHIAYRRWRWHMPYTYNCVQEAKPKQDCGADRGLLDSWSFSEAVPQTWGNDSTAQV